MAEFTQYHPASPTQVEVKAQRTCYHADTCPLVQLFHALRGISRLNEAQSLAQATSYCEVYPRQGQIGVTCVSGLVDEIPCGEMSIKPNALNN